MEIKINDKVYSVNINRKVVTYIKVKCNEDQINVICPILTSDEKVYDFLYRHRRKLYSLLNRNFLDLDKTKYIKLLGKEYQLVESTKTKIDKNIIYLDIKDKKKSFIKAISKILKDYIIPRTNYLYHQIYKDNNYPLVSIKYVKSYFGICYTKQRKISFNATLALYDLDIIDSVIIHELVHLKYPNHQKEFYRMLYMYCPNYDTIKLKRKNQEINL